MTDRHSKQDVMRWLEDGVSIIPGFFSDQEITPLAEAYETLYGDARPDADKAMNRKGDGQIGAFNRHQFLHFDALPFGGGVALDLLPLHPALIRFARAALGVPDVHLYQAHTWAKFTGETDFDQPFHCDFGNHTLTVPADEPEHRTINFVVYLTNVTDGHGALHYVTKPDAREALGEDALVAETPERQAALMTRSRSAAAPAGSVVAYGIDAFHRGTNLTLPGAHRYTMTISYKAAGNEQIGFHVWQASPERDWAPILTRGAPEQLAALGIPLPGDPFWTARTLKLTQARWPDWNMKPWMEGAEKPQ